VELTFVTVIHQDLTPRPHPHILPFGNLGNTLSLLTGYTLTDILASYQRNQSAPAQDRTHPIPPSKRSQPLRRQRNWLHRRSPQQDPPQEYRPLTPLPVFPTIAIAPQQSERPLPSPPLTQAESYTETRDLVGIPFQAFLLEDEYLATTIPTYNRDKLHAFRNHCRYLFIALTRLPHRSPTY
jgi:hypothetical protein